MENENYREKTGDGEWVKPCHVKDFHTGPGVVVRVRVGKNIRHKSLPLCSRRMEDEIGKKTYQHGVTKESSIDRMNRTLQ